jgi:acyl transferase domain-containing protein
VIVSYASRLRSYANERGSALRRAAETGVAERVAFTAERLRGVAPERRAFVADSIRDFSTRFNVSTTPEVHATAGGAGTRIARGIAERLADTQATRRTRIVDAPSRRWRVPDAAKAPDAPKALAIPRPAP